MCVFCNFNNNNVLFIVELSCGLKWSLLVMWFNWLESMSFILVGRGVVCLLEGM